MRGCPWHLEGRGQGDHRTPRSARGSLHSRGLSHPGHPQRGHRETPEQTKPCPCQVQTGLWGRWDGHALLGWMQTGGVEKIHCPFSMVLPESRVIPLRSFPCSGKSREQVRADGREARTSHSGIPGASVTEAPRALLWFVHLFHGGGRRLLGDGLGSLQAAPATPLKPSRVHWVLPEAERATVRLFS